MNIQEEIDKAEEALKSLKKGKKLKNTPLFIKYHEGFIHGLKRAKKYYPQS